MVNSRLLFVAMCRTLKRKSRKSIRNGRFRPVIDQRTDVIDVRRN